MPEKETKKPICPYCESSDVKIMSLPLEEDDEDEYIYCNNCERVSVITKVDVDVKQDQ